ncbi:MAG TPA: transcription antitermination factor NusB [Spirochaetota bacterium]|nr:transcription antitermination factor NusB [Spirochaetota bacterium]
MNIDQKNSFFKDRREGRIIAFQSVFSCGFNDTKIDDILKFDWMTESKNTVSIEYAKFLVAGTLKNLDEIDEIIKSKLKNWDINRISSVDKAILRFSIFSLLYENDLDEKIVINEAIEIAKIFGNEDSYKFINGILDAVKGTKKEKK